MKKHFKLSDYSTTFSTRTKADEIFTHFDEFIKTINADDYLVIDFAGVQAISYSFLDQFLSKVSNSPLIRERRISVSGFSLSLAPVIKESLHHRNYRGFESSGNQELLLVC